jgi:hypothetical protein
MWLVIVVVLWRVDALFGTLALAATLSRIVQAQFDLFWVAAQVSVPFAIAGICLGALARVGSETDGSHRELSDDATGRKAEIGVRETH